MSQLLKALIQSITILLIVSIIFGVGFSLMISWKFGLGAFLISAVLQFIFGYYHNIKLEKQNEMSNAEIVNNLSEQILKNASAFRVPMQLTCAYCNTSNKVPISLIEDNNFRCITCNQPNNIYMQFTTARVTQPLASHIEAGNIDLEGEAVRQTTINEPILVK